MNFSLRHRLLADVPSELRSNVINYYLDISWWGLYAGGTAAFLTIYAARVGATPAQIGLIAALPAAVQLALSLPFASVVKRISAHRATWLGAFFARLMLLLYVFLPLLPTQGVQVNAVIIIAMLMAVPSTLTGIAFSQLLMEAIPPDWRGTVVGVRNALFSIISFVFTVISGQILTRLAFPLNYQIVFFIGFVGAVMTSYQLWRVRPLKRLEGSTQPVALPANGARRFFPEITPQGRRYMRVLALLFLFNVTNNMVGPLVPGILVHRIQLSDAWISIGTALNSMLLFLVSLYFARQRLRTVNSNRLGTAAGAALVAVQAVVLALATNVGLYLLSVIIGGLGAGILLTAQFNFHLDNIPDHDRAAWLSWNLLLGNAALLIGSLGGPGIAALTTIPGALIGFGALRLLAAILILKLG